MKPSFRAFVLLSLSGWAAANLYDGDPVPRGVPKGGSIARRRVQLAARACAPTTTTPSAPTTTAAPAPSSEPAPPVTSTEPAPPVSTAEPTPTPTPEPSMIPGTWASFPAPDTKSLIVIKDAAKFPEQVVQRTLSGIVSRAVTSKSDSSVSPVWIDTGKTSDGVWRDRLSARLGLNATEEDLWSVVKGYADKGIVKGFVVYNQDTSGNGASDASSNIATALCAPLSAIAVTPDLIDAATAAGLTQLADARTMSFGDLQTQYGEQLSKSTLGLLRTDMAPCRDMIVAQGAAVGIDKDGQGYVDLLQRLEPGATVIGYGTSEDGSVHSASTVGAGLVASDWMSNWNVLSLGAGDITPPSLAGGQGAVQDDGESYYVALVMTDGDNIQWVLGDYASSPTWYGAPERGEIPFTWGLPVSTLAQTAPDALSWFAETRNPTNDAFANFGDPYLYIDSSSSDPTTFTTMVAKHQQWAHLTNLSTAVIFCEDWTSAGSQAGFDIIAKGDPLLDAAFMIQYSSYAAGRGALRFGTREDGSQLPVLTAKTHLWSQPDSEEAGGPAHIADLLNSWSNSGAKDVKERVAWVPVNAWSTFELEDGRKVGGYNAARELAGLLGEGVKLVTLPDIASLLKAAA
ncbi:hypothetical protein EXIGLDRAFT_830250 [Exidia glandulosa HHB12029]|uniref:Uncharacterized protein n=1 Tax=Exidia glandulosa HHB12029 TaxID=1314781 RepID=A0A165NPQ5_EXIGL|nr:hypothetical protein EXIGLDRAFT_830250 [Exidia glandulosa HHB12029]